jgi:hypothetical protein
VYAPFKVLKSAFEKKRRLARPADRKPSQSFRKMAYANSPYPPIKGYSIGPDIAEVSDRDQISDVKSHKVLKLDSSFWFLGWILQVSGIEKSTRNILVTNQD